MTDEKPKDEPGPAPEPKSSEDAAAPQGGAALSEAIDRATAAVGQDDGER